MILALSGAPQVTIVFPCLNEADAVAHCVREAAAAFAAAGVRGEVVVCDNGSVDGSPAAAFEAGARVVHEEHRGYGAALATGIEAACGEYIILADADGTYDLAAIGAMVEHLNQGADIVMGNRFAGTIDPGAMPWLNRHVGSPVLSGLLNLFFATRVGDGHCGLRAFTRAAYDRMDLQTTGMEFASEMLARAARLKLRIDEVPVHYRVRTGETKLRRYRDGWRHLRFLLMYSPTWLYGIPSVLLGSIGLTILVALAIGRVEFAGRVWDMHLSAVAGLVTTLAAQLGWLGIAARTFAVIYGFEPENTFIPRFYQRFHLETALVIAAGLVLVGAGVVTWVVWGWVAEGFPPLDGIRLLLLGTTLIVVGVQSAFNAFFLSLMGIETRLSPIHRR